MHLLAEEKSPFNERLVVYETTRLFGETGKYRILQFADTAVQGAVDLKEPSRVVLPYQRALLHLLERNSPSFEDVFVLGHGVGTIAGRYPRKRFVVAEIDEKVVELSRLYFNYRLDNVTVGDGRSILLDQAPGSFDCIIVDAFDSRGTPRHLTSVPFFELTAEKAKERGLIIVNIVGKSVNDKLVNAVYSSMRQCYGCTKAFFLPGEDDDGFGNVLLFGSGGTIEYDYGQLAGFVEIELEEGYPIRENGRAYNSESGRRC